MHALSPVSDIIADAKAGRMFVLVDDEARENEGDLIVPAQFADGAAINFMAKYGRGLICLALTEARVEHLGLPLMARHNQSRHSTAFTVSIEAREGVTTGISAADRARTIAAAIDPARGAADIVSPGHVFPLVARDGGVLVRAGHTEAAVDIARLAGLTPAGVICEIMKDDGHMARLPDLLLFAARHGLKIGTIADLIAHRRRSEKLVEKILEQPFASRFGGEFTLKLYRSHLSGAEHIALVKGELALPPSGRLPRSEGETSSAPVLVRMHALNVLADTLHDADNPKSGELAAAMRKVAEAGRGVVVLLRSPLPDAISQTLRGRAANAGAGGETKENIRDYGIGAQILLDIGVRDMLLLSNGKKQVVGLEGYGLNIVGYEAIPVEG